MLLKLAGYRRVFLFRHPSSIRRRLPLGSSFKVDYNGIPVDHLPVEPKSPRFFTIPITLWTFNFEPARLIKLSSAKIFY